VGRLEQSVPTKYKNLPLVISSKEKGE
jgi:hypothetical protein